MYTTEILQKTSTYETANNVDDKKITANNLNGVDVLKFICSILVCLLHSTPLFPEDIFDFSEYVNLGIKQYICRLAVPFFFVSSGYFLFRKIDLQNFDSSKIKEYCFKIVFQTGIWFMLLRQTGTFHLWYLGATVLAVVLLSLLLKKQIRIKCIVIISSLLYIVGLLGDSYYDLVAPLRNNFIINQIFVVYEWFFGSTRNGIFMGFIFIFMGFIFAQKEIKININFARIGFIVSMLLLLAEVLILVHLYGDLRDYNMYIFLLPATFFLFYWVSNLKLKDKAIYKKLRYLSTLIYFLHVFAGNSTLFVNTAIYKFLGIDISAFFAIERIILVIAMSVFIEYMSHKKSLTWLKRLYT